MDVVALLLVDHLVRTLEVPLQSGVGLELLEALRAGLARHETLLRGHFGLLYFLLPIVMFMPHGNQILLTTIRISCVES